MARFLVCAAMRNEGPFLLEWVAWQRMLGFDDILITYNNCTDHSPQMLEKLAEAGWITTLQMWPPKDKAPKFWAHKKMRAHPVFETCDWVFICDVDEFLVLHSGDGTVPGYLGHGEPNARLVAVYWKVFGHGGQLKYADGLVHRDFVLGPPSNDPANGFFKCFTYQPTRFKVFGAHTPKLFDGDWGAGQNVMIDSSGREIVTFDPAENPKHSSTTRYITHATAQLNHYIIRSLESFEFKRGRKSASRGVDRYGDDFLAKHDVNTDLDESALKYRDRFDAVYAEITAIPGIMELHHLSCADYIARMCEKRGDDPAADPRWVDHMAQAAALRG